MCGFGCGTAKEFVRWRTDHPREKIEPNMFMQRGTLFEPLVRQVYEVMSGNMTFDGGYWLAKCEWDNKFFGTSPDFVLMQDNMESPMSELYHSVLSIPENPCAEDIVGAGELKFMLSYQMFDDSVQKMEHVTQCYQHMWSVGAPFTDYLAVMASEHAKDNGSFEEPFIKHLLFCRVHRQDWFMEWLYHRLKAASHCQSWNRAHPAAQVMVEWERESSSTFSNLNIEYFYREEKRCMVSVGDEKFSPYHLNKIHACKGWNTRKFPDGVPWETLDSAQNKM